MHRYCLTLDLIDDPQLIAAYEQHHKNVWPEIIKSITDSGIVDMQIYRLYTRLFMIMETNEHFSFEKKAAMDAGNQIVQQWETLMLNYQKLLPFAAPGQKWMLMDRIFELKPL
jgi:L-rhamnose mutarotase